MAGRSSTIVVRVLGNTKGLNRTLKRANDSLGGLDRTAGAITSGMRFAAIAVAAVGAAAVGAGAVGAVALAALPAALIGLGVLAAAQSKAVRSAFGGLAKDVKADLIGIAKPLEPVLVAGAGKVRAAFDRLAPSLARIFADAAPVLSRLFDLLLPLAGRLGAVLERAFKAGTPVLEAFARGLIPVMDGLSQFFAVLGTGTPQFTRFAGSLMKGLGALLPALGRLLVALAPLGTTILEALIPALIGLFDWIGAKVVPVLTAMAGWLGRNKTFTTVLVGALVGLVVAIRLVQGAMALVNAVMVIYKGLAMGIRAAIIVWKNAQLALNLAMMLNPVGLVVAAIVALVAIIVIAYKKSETFRRIVDKAWGAIKAATGAVFGWIADKIGAVIGGAVRLIGRFVTTVLGLHLRVLRAFAGAGKWLVSAGADLVRGLVNGLLGAGAWLKSKITAFISEHVPGPVKRILGIGSPSKLFKQYGKWTVEGLAIGLKGAAGVAAKASSSLAGAVADGFDAPKLSLNARPALSGATGGASGGRTYQITVNVPVGASSEDVGRELVKHIAAFERAGGRRRA